MAVVAGDKSRSVWDSGQKVALRSLIRPHFAGPERARSTLLTQVLERPDIIIAEYSCNMQYRREL